MYHPPRSIPRLQEKYKLLGTIGEGTYGIVFKAEYKNTEDQSKAGKLLAVKSVKIHKEGRNNVVLSMATLREIKLLRELRHDNVVTLEDVHLDPLEKSLALVFIYAEHDLRQLIVHAQRHGPRMPEHTIKSIVWQILNGLHYLHENWVIHRDLKPQNILVIGQGPNRGRVQIADFGLARIFQSPVKSLSDVERVVVTLWYRAPELLLGAKHYTKAIDIWAVGCIFAEIITTKELFCGKEVAGRSAPFQADQCDKIFQIMGLPSEQKWKGISLLPLYFQIANWHRERNYPQQSNLKAAVPLGSGPRAQHAFGLLSQMLELDPEKRMSAAEALLHPYFTEQQPLPTDQVLDPPNRPALNYPPNPVRPLRAAQVNQPQPQQHKRSLKRDSSGRTR